MSSRYDKFKNYSKKSYTEDDGYELKAPLIDQVEDFDWGRNQTQKITLHTVKAPIDNIQISLNKLHSLCSSCTMCDIGRQYVTDNGIYRDPHLPNSINNNNIIAVYYNPSIADIKRRDMLLKETNVFGLNAYITYIIKCCSQTYNNDHLRNCNTFLDLEIKIIRPKLIIAMDEKSFDYLKSDKSAIYQEHIKRSIKSIYNYKMIGLNGTVNNKSFIDKLSKTLNPSN